MSKELIVSTGRHETKVAILEDDVVVELFHEREKEYSLAGSIHKGRVTRVLPGMQSAFVDIGLERDAFLYVSDFFEDNEEYDAVVSGVEEKVLRLDKGGEKAAVAEAAAMAPAAEGEAAQPASEAIGENTNAETGAAPAAAGERPPSGRPERGERSGGERGERGGRGRRGRRRRGGRGGSGLPDSKFFSPRAAGAGASAGPMETEGAADGVAESDAGEGEDLIEEAALAATEVSEASPAKDDFMVLPGESLAKYSAPEESASAGTARAAEPVAAPAEKPLSGFGLVSSWIARATARRLASEDVTSPETTPLVETRSHETRSHETRAHEPKAAVEEPVAGEAVAIAAVPVEPVFEEAAAPVIDHDASLSDGVASDLPDEDGLSGGEVAEIEAAGDLAVEDSAAELMEGDGPEPARTPTSLTATLREQGHRYPHRVSRRMRRKMRSGQEPRAEKGASPAGTEPVEGAEEAVNGEVKTVAPREERRPERGERGDRPERAERGERPERGERGERSERGGRGERQRGERGGERTERTERPERERPPLPSIADLLKEGQEIIVQIAKEPLGQKGARITSHIALPGRFVVYMPTVEHVGVSRKIPSDEERQRLKRVLQTHRQGIPGGFICRTAAENKTEEELSSDMHFLYNLWLDMRQKAEKSPAPKLLHHDLDLVQRILRDQLTTSFKTIWVDNEELYESILRFVERFQPGLIGRVKLYTRSNPIFDEFGVTAEIEKALRPKVWLKSGGYIVINQTEALVAIDINTGKYVGKSNRLEDTIVKVNTDAIKEIVRQIRLRDLGGIIVVDFIDMDERRNRQKVMIALEDAMRVDRAPYKILQFNDFGLVAITRKRVKQSLERTLCAPCPYCEGAGHIKNVQTVISEILTEAQRMHRALEVENGNLMLRVNPEVAKVLKSNHNSYLQEIEEILKKPVLVKSDPLLHQTKFDLA